MNYGIKVSYRDFNVINLTEKQTKKHQPKSNKSLSNLLSGLALPYLIGAKKQVKRYRVASLLLQSQPTIGVLECMHEASNLFEDLNTVAFYIKKCGRNNKYHQLWNNIRNHIRHAVREDYDIEDKLIKNNIAQKLNLDPKLQISIGFDIGAIKVGGITVKIDEITNYLTWAEDIITKILKKGEQEGLLKRE